MAKLIRCFLLAELTIVMCGCTSPESLRADTVSKTARCLQVGIKIESADTCLKSVGMELATSADNHREYMRTASGPWIFSESNVYFDLKFDAEDKLLTWSTRAGVDTM